MECNPSYGTERIAIAMGRSENKVRRIKQKFNLYPVQSKRKPKRKRSCKVEAPYPNLIKDLTVIAPRTVYASDFTYIRFDRSFVYLATVIDLYTREIVGWKLGSRHTSELVKAALLDTIHRTGCAPRIIHSDQGSEYQSYDYTSLVKSYDIKISMSAKASPWQNGFQESYYCGFKEDLGAINGVNDLGVLAERIHHTINYYNKHRIHTALKMPPREFFKQSQKLRDAKLLKQG